MKNGMGAVAIIPHPSKEVIINIVPQVIAWLRQHDVEVRLLREDAAKINAASLGCDEPELLDGADMVLVMGGDGTVLRAARLMQRRTLPVFGVNLGRIGFLMDFNEENIYPSLERVLTGEFHLEERSMLTIDVEFSDGSRLNRTALNEVLISGREFNRLIELDVHINGGLYSHFALDGIIISTPTGATAYSFSAGGPLVSPRAETLILAPINPHSLFNRVMVLAPNDTVLVESTAKKKPDDLRLSLDGIVIGRQIKWVTAALAPEKFKFIKLGPDDYYMTIRDKVQKLDEFKGD